MDACDHAKVHTLAFCPALTFLRAVLCDVLSDVLSDFFVFVRRFARHLLLSDMKRTLNVCNSRTHSILRIPRQRLLFFSSIFLGFTLYSCMAAIFSPWQVLVQRPYTLCIRPLKLFSSMSFSLNESDVNTTSILFDIQLPSRVMSVRVTICLRRLFLP